MFNSGGMERVITNKANSLADSYAMDVTIITTDQRDKPLFYTLSQRVKHQDLRINFFEIQNQNIVCKTLDYIKKQKEFQRKLSSLISVEKFDVIISTFGPESEWLYRLKDESKKVLEIHFSKFFRLQRANTGFVGLLDRWRSHQDDIVIQKYDRFIVLTNEDKSYWRNYSNIEVIHNASTFTPLARATLKNKRVISVGRLTYQKGYDMLVDAWALVAAKHPDWCLTIIGGGEEFEQRRAQINSLGIGRSVELLPPSSTIEHEYLDSSIYALSSRYEGLPMVLLEAMACGVPAVAFACKCGPQDVITDGVNGLLVEDGDVSALAAGICKLIENPELRQIMGEEAARSVRKKFNEEKIMQQWVELLKNISNKT